MNVAALAQLINVHPDTIRRWCKDYHQFMSPSATPQKGRTRAFTTHDAAVLSYIATARDSSVEPNEIVQRLMEMQENGWNGLPDLPSEWFADPTEETMTVEVAAVRASQVAQIAVLQKELEHTRIELETTQNTLLDAQQKVERLENEIAAMRSSNEAATGEITNTLHQRELELERAKQDVARLEGQLQQYGLGRENPVNVGLIILVTAVIVAVLVITLLVVVRLVL